MKETFRNTLLRFIFAGVAASSIAIADDSSVPQFTTQSIDPDISIGYGIAIGEVDGDGQPDILLADKTEIVWYQNPGKRGERWNRHVMARNLTAKDNVCIAARDVTGDGLVEVAVGANWNPGETSDTSKSGALFYLERPDDPTSMWSSVVIGSHDPTTHRMQWVKSGDRFSLVVLPLHGRDNEGGRGTPVRIMSYTPKNDFSDWSPKVIDESMHMTHNFDVESENGTESVLVAGREGIARIADRSELLVANPPSHGAGEVRAIDLRDGLELVTIEPMHGNEVVYYREDGNSWTRKVLDDSLAQGHAIATGDFLRTGKPQVIAGWRDKNSRGDFGIRLYAMSDEGSWSTHAIDENGMACEDLKLADLDGDEKPEIIAAGRATKNVTVYWNDN